MYLGRSEGIGGFQRIVAVKLLHPHLLEDASSQASNEFLEEAKLSARMQHPMIVPVMDVGHSDEGFFLVMDYVDGASLSEIAREGFEIPHSIALRILSDALEGLEAAHQAKDEKGRHLGIVHRDFSPQNILVGVDGRSRLTDFGIARATTRAEYTRTGLVKGKIAYMSPEQAEGKPLDIRSDVWAAGVVAWELFAGRRMYPQMDPMPMMLRIINDPPPKIRKANPTLPLSLEEALDKALEPSRKERCPSAQEFRALLVEAMGGERKLASREAVGAFVAALEIKRLDELRAIVQEESRSLELGASGLSSEEVQTIEERGLVPDGGSGNVESGTFATASAEIPAALATEEMERKLVQARRKPTFVVAAIGVALLLALVGTLGPQQWRQRPEPQVSSAASQTKVLPPANQPPEKNNPESDEEPRDPQVRAQGESSNDEPPLLPRTEITVSAGEPFESVTVGSRTIVLPSPTRTATLHLREDEQTGDLSVVAMTKDGRKAQKIAGEHDEAVQMNFATPERRPRVKTTNSETTSKPSPASDLAASPY